MESKKSKDVVDPKITKEATDKEPTDKEVLMKKAAPTYTNLTMEEKFTFLMLLLRDLSDNIRKYDNHEMKTYTRECYVNLKREVTFMISDANRYNEYWKIVSRDIKKDK